MFALTAATVASAEPQPPLGAKRHVVKPGDTLWDISRQRYGSPLAWPGISRRNAVTEPRLLQPGRELLLDGPLTDTPQRVLRRVRSTAAGGIDTQRVVRVLAATGDVQWMASAPDGSRRAAQTAQTGMVLPGGAVIRTGPDSFVTLGLPDGSRSTLPSQSEVRIARVPGRGGLPAALLELSEGEVDARVPPRASLLGAETFRVRTRMATVGVRGTHFRVGLAPQVGALDGTTVGVQEGRVWVRSKEAPGETEVDAGNGLFMDPASSGGTLQALLPAPELLDAGRGQHEPVVVIAWSAVPGAAGYRVQLARDAEFVDIFAERRVTADASNGLAMFEGVPAGSWFARAAAVSPQWIEGAAAVASFARVPATLETSASMVTDGDGVEFRWTTLPGTAYQLQIATDARFEQLVLNAPGLYSGQVRIRTLSPGQYWWRVRGTSWSQGQRSQMESVTRPLLVEGVR